VNCLISYEPFWETLKSKNITTYALINKYNISSATIDRMKKGGGISTMKIDDFCRILNCDVSDIIKYTKED
jgi:DNA-binding Xre family transcriptional regulator